MIEGLVQVDDKGNYAPVLAEALPTVSEDGLTVTYQLKPGVKFSNGDPFTCADVNVHVRCHSVRPLGRQHLRLHEH